jgi:uncharacterized membrane protein (DUF485 family)
VHRRHLVRGVLLGRRVAGTHNFIDTRRCHMDHSTFERIRRDRRFQELIAKRTRFAWGLSATMLVIYFGFIFIIAFAPKSLGTPIGSGVTTIGIPLGLFVIVSAFVLTGI